ncbi:MAG: sigma-54-dependent Fis family transcriptional regulator [Candidatus Tectomicrobia bacterium]|uniref:Sigma-54-dependent Fis family transcriptional regulator n=1 Tax=Tectimicrobiota bacterium TaxID=2528274 RepID=A0A932HZS4_UNCTE|nr:sigma-54-dependent Fis family transcriptional regulator [Candidatus Tectomicrobia bacterium]
MIARILLVEDCVKQRTMIRHGLNEFGFEIIEADNVENAKEKLRHHIPDIFVIDLHLPGRDGFDFCVDIQQDPALTSIPRLMLTGDSTMDNQLLGLSEYVDDYVTKPFRLELLNARIKALLRRYNPYLLSDNTSSVDLQALPESNDAYPTFGSGIIGASKPMLDVFASLKKFAQANAPVLITGESGTGKELAARTIHERSSRSGGPFVSINCGAIPDNLLEAELFGYERGAFTGAHARKKGKVEMAHGGTLFFDEIGELSLSLQVKLLRFLETYRFERLGGMESLKVDVLFVAATNKNLQRAIEAGTFREDLYFRLAVLSLELPPLRTRGEDKIIISNALLKRFSQEARIKVEGFAPDALNAIRMHHWPGNVRELANCIRRALVMTDHRWIRKEDLNLSKGSDGMRVEVPGSLHEAKEQTERMFLEEAIARHKGNLSRAARELGISRPTLYGRIKKYNLRPDALGNS